MEKLVNLPNLTLAKEITEKNVLLNIPSFGGILQCMQCMQCLFIITFCNVPDFFRVKFVHLIYSVTSREFPARC